MGSYYPFLAGLPYFPWIWKIRMVDPVGEIEDKPESYVTATNVVVGILTGAVTLLHRAAGYIPTEH